MQRDVSDLSCAAGPAHAYHESNISTDIVMLTNGFGDSVGGLQANGRGQAA